MKNLMNKLLVASILLAALVTAAILGRGFWLASRSIFELLTENRELKQTIANLTVESQIGMAKVISQTVRDGRTYTRLKFVETARDDATREVLSREYELEGEDIYFDALIVKFAPSYVGDGKERALYLWRGIFSEKVPPTAGCAIEERGAEPKRYAEVFAKLPVRDRELFWPEMWKLSDDANRLKAAGVQAVYGNALHKPLKPGYVYLFKIGNNGQFYLETLLAM